MSVSPLFPPASNKRKMTLRERLAYWLIDKLEPYAQRVGDKRWAEQQHQEDCCYKHNNWLCALCIGEDIAQCAVASAGYVDDDAIPFDV